MYYIAPIRNLKENFEDLREESLSIQSLRDRAILNRMQFLALPELRLQRTAIDPKIIL